MAPFDRPHTNFYWSTIVSIALSGTIFELFDVEWYHDLETWVRRHSRSFKSVLFESLGAVSYSPSIVTMALSCIICEIKQDIGRRSWFFHSPLAFNAPVRMVPNPPSEYCHPVWYKKTRMVGLPDGEKNFEDMYNHLGTIPACDRWTDRHLATAMHMRRAVKIWFK